MVIYFAGECPISYDKLIDEFGVTRILQSYFYIRDKMPFAKHLNSKVQLFLDSGAYTAWTKRKRINIDLYIGFVKRLQPHIFAGLDVIKNPESTKINVDYMVRKGLKPIPTFHRGSDYKHLEVLLETELYDYIALGGLVGTKTDLILKHLDRCFKMIEKIRPNVKVHGFGMTGISVMKSFPWFSVDSTAWLAPVLFGKDIDGMSNLAILREETGFIKMKDITNNFNKEKQREIILKRSVEQFLRIEAEINKHHSYSEFNNLKQGELFNEI